MNSLLRNTLALGAISLFSLASTYAKADSYTYFPNDTTINTAINTNYAIVGYSSGTFISGNNFADPSSPTVGLVNGGSVNSLYAYNNSKVNVSGGSATALFAHDSSVVNFSSGNVVALYAHENSAVSVSNIGVNFLDAYESSKVSVSGGNVSELDIYNSSIANISGGNVQYFSSNGSSTVNLTGGLVGSYGAYNTIGVDGSSTLNIFGENLTAPYYTQTTGGAYSIYLLNGTLQDGTNLPPEFLYVQNGSGASFHLFNTAATPAPSSVLVILMGAVPLAGVLRRRHK